jgi:hypothetical protein
LTSSCGGVTFADQTVNLTAGSNADLTFNYTPTPSTCSCDFTATIDPDNAIFEGSNSNNSVIYTNDPPGAFDLVAPMNGSTTTTTAGLGAVWEASADPDGEDVTYTLEIWHDPTDTRWGMDVFYHKREGFTGNSCVIQAEAGFIGFRSYIWRVTAIDEYASETPCNDDWGFDVVPTDETPADAIPGILFPLLGE